MFLIPTVFNSEKILPLVRVSRVVGEVGCYKNYESFRLVFESYFWVYFGVTSISGVTCPVSLVGTFSRLSVNDYSPLFVDDLLSSTSTIVPLPFTLRSPSSLLSLSTNYYVSDSSESKNSSLVKNISLKGSLSRDILGSLAFLRNVFKLLGSIWIDFGEPTGLLLTSFSSYFFSCSFAKSLICNRVNIKLSSRSEMM